MRATDLSISIAESESGTRLPARLEALVPDIRDLFEIAIFATLLRVTLFLIVSLHFHCTFHQWANRDDGSSYLAYARALLGNPSQMTPYDQRVFPGYPALIAVAHLLGIPLEAAAVGLDWLCAGLVAAMGAALFRDRRVGWALTCLPLQYFINSSLAMSETPMLALSLGGLLLAARGKSTRGGILLGLAGLVRPMACFAVVGQVFRDLVGTPDAAPSPPYSGERAGVRGDASSRAISDPEGTAGNVRRGISRRAISALRCLTPRIGGAGIPACHELTSGGHSCPPESTRIRSAGQECPPLADSDRQECLPHQSHGLKHRRVRLGGRGNGALSATMNDFEEPSTLRVRQGGPYARNLRAAAITLILAGGVVLIGIAALHHWTGDAFRGAKVYANAPNTYNGHLMQWPFHSLIHESLRPEVPLSRVIYIWLHVAITLTALALVSLQCLRYGRGADARDWLAAPWLAGNTLFVLCIGSYWGFEHFPRFTIPALPATFWALRGLLPRRRIAWAGIAAIILVAAVFVVLHDFVVPD